MLRLHKHSVVVATSNQKQIEPYRVCLEQNYSISALYVGMYVYSNNM